MRPKMLSLGEALQAILHSIVEDDSSEGESKSALWGGYSGVKSGCLADGGLPVQSPALGVSNCP